jgi:hypothetical protein
MLSGSATALTYDLGRHFTMTRPPEGAGLRFDFAPNYPKMITAKNQTITAKLLQNWSIEELRYVFPVQLRPRMDVNSASFHCRISGAVEPFEGTSRDDQNTTPRCGTKTMQAKQNDGPAISDGCRCTEI